MIDSQLLTTGALLGASGAVLYQLKSLPKLAYTKIKQKLIYTTKIYQYDELFESLEKWLSHHHNTKYKDVEATTGQNTGYTMPSTDEERQRPTIRYKQEDDTFILNYKGKRILINKSKEKLDKAQNIKDIYFRKYSLSGIRAKKNIEELLEEVVDFAMQDEKKNTIKVYSSSQWGEWYAGSTIKVKPVEKVVLPPLLKNTLMDDVSLFLQSEEWYSDVCIPYKRGYCFFGPPGTGKTTLALAIANRTKRNIFCLNLNSLDNDTCLPKAFASINDNSILLIEDIDKVFSGRDNVKGESKITFSSLLNCLDGAFYKKGLIVIITTNHIDKLDEALLRTGRIDVKIEVGKPSDREISQYLTLFYQNPINVYGNFDVKMSDVQEICIQNRNSSQKAKEKLLSTIKQLQ